jgi:hypothetical protein
LPVKRLIANVEIVVGSFPGLHAFPMQPRLNGVVGALYYVAAFMTVLAIGLGDQVVPLLC